MARAKMATEELTELEDDDVDAEVDDEVEPDKSDEDRDESAESDDYDSGDGSSKDHDEETVEALEELESQELKLLDEEANEALLVDEVEELRAIRREELTMNVDAQVQRSDEFVCQSCFMVKRTSQLANRRKMLCNDCAY